RFDMPHRRRHIVFGCKRASERKGTAKLHCRRLRFYCRRDMETEPPSARHSHLGLTIAKETSVDGRSNDPAICPPTLAAWRASIGPEFLVTLSSPATRRRFFRNADWFPDSGTHRPAAPAESCVDDRLQMVRPDGMNEIAQMVATADHDPFELDLLAHQ